MIGSGRGEHDREQVVWRGRDRTGETTEGGDGARMRGQLDME